MNLFEAVTKIQVSSWDTSYPNEVTFYITFDKRKTYREVYSTSPPTMRSFLGIVKHKNYGKAYDYLKKRSKKVSSEVANISLAISEYILKRSKNLC